ncbi:BTAD domain-containing putative transcriptional regulator [Sphingomonas sp. PB2P19]|uniref:AfsR/SARP family transcriptional regulator n=1 Tax=Sphingomonas rhamnosi TaxID=3096156 RepID=UPI002FCC2D1F
MATWSIQLFGGGTLSLTGHGVLAMPETWWSVIGSLVASPNRRATRSKLAAAIWPEKDELAARRCLATTLWRFKTRMPGGASPIRPSGDFVALASDTRLWIDVLAFERRAAAAVHHPASLADASVRARLARALALYRDDFLREHGGDAIALERERLRTLHLDATYALAMAESAAANWPAARTSLQRLVSAEPLREDAQRLLMTAHVECGNQALAIQQFHAYAALLGAELGVEPMPATLALAARIGATSAPVRIAPDTHDDIALRATMLRVRRDLMRTLRVVDQVLAAHNRPINPPL